MPSLFDFETAEQVRARIGKSGREQDLSIAGLSGAQQANLAGAQAGRLFAQALGGESPEVTRAKKLQEITSRIDPSNPYEGLLSGAKELQEGGFTGEAFQLLEAAQGFEPKKKKETNLFGKIDPSKFEQASVDAFEASIATGTPDYGLLVPRKKTPLVKVDTGDKKFNSLTISALETAGADADIGSKTIQSLDFIDNALRGLDTGALTDVGVKMAGIASSLGLPFDEKRVASLESAQGAMGDLVMAILGKFKGAISDGERAFAQSMVPKLTQTPEGRTQLSKYMRKVAKRASVRNDMLEDHVVANPNRGSIGFRKVWNKYQEENPLFPPTIKEDAKSFKAGESDDYTERLKKALGQ